MFGRFNSILIKGLITLLPLTVTVYLITWMAGSLEGSFGSVITAFLPEGYYIPGLGILMALTTIFFVGLIVEHYLTQRAVDGLERQLKRLPVVRAIYSPLRDLTDLLSRAQSSSQGGTSQRVVFIRFAPGVELMGLVMRDRFDDLPGQPIEPGKVAVFVPFSYGFGGTTYIVDSSSVRETKLSADRALQLAITGWVKANKSQG